jgi:hypothetical protein
MRAKALIIRFRIRKFRVKRNISALATIFAVGLTITAAIVFDQPVPVSAAVAPLTTSGVMFYGDTTNAGIMRGKTFSSPATLNAEFNGITGSASNILHVTAKTAHTREEMMIGSLRVNGTLQIESCTAACDANGDFTNRWSHASVSGAQDCDNAPTAGTCFQSFDIGYEALNGKAMVVYAGDGADGGTVTDTDTVYYAEWSGSAWAPNATPGTPGTSNDIDLGGAGATAGTPQWIRFIPTGDHLADDRSNRGMLLVSDSNSDLWTCYWDGTSFTCDTAARVTDLENCGEARCFDGSWQGVDTFVMTHTDADGTNDVKYQKYVVDSGWTVGETQAYTTSASTAWIVSTADPTSSRIYSLNTSTGNDTRGAIWRGDDATDGWTVCNSGNCPDTSAEAAGGPQTWAAFERFNGEALHIYNDAAQNNAQGNRGMTFTPNSTWSTSALTGITPVDDHQNTKAWGSPNSDDILIAAADVDCRVDAVLWDGAAYQTAINDFETVLASSNNTCVNSVPVRGMMLHGYDFAWKEYTPWQRNWQFFSGSDTASSPTTTLANENATPSGFDATTGKFRLRVNYADRGRSISNTEARKKLQYTTGCNPNSALETTCTWTDVDDQGGSGIWRYDQDSDLACSPTDCDDNTTLTATKLTGSSTCSAGLGCGTWVNDKDLAGGTNMDHTAQATADTVQESEYVVEANGAGGLTTYYFRLYNVDQDTPVYREQDANDCGTGSAQCTYPSLTTSETNVAPSTPTVLTQQKSGPVTLDAGTWTSAQDITFTATVSDPNTSATLQLCVEKVPVTTAFTSPAGDGDACGTGVAYSGTPVTASVTISGQSAGEYHWQVKVKDEGGFYSSWTPYTTANTHTQPSDAETVGRYSSVAIGTDGLPVISYYEQAPSAGDLRVRKCSNTACTSASETEFTTDDIGLFSKVKIGTDGYPIIAYYNASNGGDLNILHCTNVSCSSSDSPVAITEGTDDIGSHTALAIGSDGFPVIAHYNFSDGDLMITKCGNVSCSSGNTTHQVTSAQDIGTEASIAISTDGYPVIAYHNATSTVRDLIIYKCTSLDCSTGSTNAVEGTWWGLETSIAISTDGFPVIAHYDDNTQNAVVTKCSNADCSSVTSNTQITTTDIDGFTLSLALSSDGFPIIASNNNSDGDLNVIHCTNAACSTFNTPVEISDGDIAGKDVSLALGWDGLPVITHWNDTDDEIVITKCGSYTCALTNTDPNDRDYGIDITAPTGGTVYDGTSIGSDQDFNDGSRTSLSGNWSGFTTTISSLNRYEYSISTTACGADVRSWTEAGRVPAITARGLTISTTGMYHLNVRTIDNAGNATSCISSDGQMILPNLTFTLSSTNVTFDALDSSNSFDDTEPDAGNFSLTTTTNAANGYTIRAYLSGLLEAPVQYGSPTIASFNGGSYASPDSWQFGDTGFAYTSTDTSVAGVNKFAINPCPGGSTLTAPGCYAPFSTTAPGDIVADGTGPATSQGFDMFFRVATPNSQRAAPYSANIIYTNTPQY